MVLLAEHFLARACADYGLPAKTLAPDARAALVAYRWPGNVRELINTMERVALLAEASVVTADVLGSPTRGRARCPGVPAAPPRGRWPPSWTAPSGPMSRRRSRPPAGTSRARRRAWASPATRSVIAWRSIGPASRRSGAAPPASTATACAAVPATSPCGSGGPPAAALTGIRWERRRLAILLATLASGRDVGPLDTGRVIEVLVEKARSFGGRVEELGAGGFVALFGLEPIEDPVRRAALAAVAMQRAVERTSDGRPGPGIRIGIDLGSFLLGRLPDASLVDAEDKRTVLSAMGALLEGAEPGTVVVSAAGAPFLARGFDLFPARRGARATAGVPARSARARGDRGRPSHALRRP